MKLNKIHHVAVICSDYERSKQFYTDVLGLRIVSEHYRKERDSWKADCWLGSTYANIVQAVKKCYKQNFDSGVYGSVFYM